MSGDYDGLRASVMNVPEFVIDLGANTNQWHRENQSSPSVEPWETQIFTKLLTDHPRILDIGCNIGWYSLVASAVTGGKAEIHGFEPEPSNIQLIRNNLEANKFTNVRLWPIALGDREQRAKLYISKDNIGDHRLHTDEQRDFVEIEVKTLDSVLRPNNFIPDLVKIDVQGAEVGVLDGGVETFRKAGSELALLIEFQPEALGMDNALKLIDRLADFNRPMYDLYPYEGGRLRRITKEMLSDALNGCLNPKYNAHIDILVAPFDYRLDRLRPLIGPDFEQWAVPT